MKVHILCCDNALLPAGSQAETPVKPAFSPGVKQPVSSTEGISSPVLHQAGPQLASYRLDPLDSGGSSWSSNYLVCPVIY